MAGDPEGWLGAPLHPRRGITGDVPGSPPEDELDDGDFGAPLGGVPVGRFNGGIARRGETTPPPPPSPTNNGSVSEDPWANPPRYGSWDGPDGDPDGIKGASFAQDFDSGVVPVDTGGGFVPQPDTEDGFGHSDVPEDRDDGDLMDLFDDDDGDAISPVEPVEVPPVDSAANTDLGESNQSEDVKTPKTPWNELVAGVFGEPDDATEGEEAEFAGGIEDLFDDDDLNDLDDGSKAGAVPVAVPATGRLVVRDQAASSWQGGGDHYEDEHINVAAERVANRAAGLPDVTSLVRQFVLTRDVEVDRRQRAELERVLEPHLASMKLTLPIQDVPQMLDMVYDEILGLGPLGAAWRSPEVTEIMVDGWDSVVVEVGGRLHPTNLRFRSADHAAGVARSLAEKVSDRQLSPNSPLVTAKLDGARVNFAYGPVVPDLGLSVSIRKFDAQMDMRGLLEVGALTEAMAELLGGLIGAKATVLVSGATGAGKTTMLAAVAEAIANDERIITIEDARELDLGRRLSWVPLQTKERASADDTALVGQDALLENCLRMRPDRIIVGEVRDGKAASVMLAAANTGHEGTMTTIHANSVSDALNSRLVRLVRRVEDSPVEVVREEVAEAFNLVVQVTRRRGRRFISEISEIDPAYIVDTKIVPRVLWKGRLGPGGSPVFEHVGDIDPVGRLAERLSDFVAEAS